MKREIVALNHLLTAKGNSFLGQEGVTLKQRTAPFKQWVDARKQSGIWPYNHALSSSVDDCSEVMISESESCSMINLSAQDNLGLARRQELKYAAIEAMDSNGIHSACSASLAGSSNLSRQIEHKLTQLTGLDEALVFNTGWSACYGVIVGLVTSKDHIVMDALAHNSLSQGCKQATTNRHTFLHNNLDHLEQKLKSVRSIDSKNGIFVVTESLFSMHADSPSIKELVSICHANQAILILDVSHDFGAMGANGLGKLGEVDAAFFDNLVVCGSFSKTFGASGGFVLSPEGVRDRLVAFSPTYMFSLSLSPINCGIINCAIDIVFSEEGRKLRKKLKSNAQFARSCFKALGIVTIGEPGPVMPVLLGNTDKARMATKLLFENKVLVNLVEYPAVQLNQSMFRIQISAAFSFAFILDFTKKISQAINHAAWEVDQDGFTELSGLSA